MALDCSKQGLSSIYVTLDHGLFGSTSGYKFSAFLLTNIPHLYFEHENISVCFVSVFLCYLQINIYTDINNVDESQNV